MNIKKAFFSIGAIIQVFVLIAQNPTEVNQRIETIGDINGNALYVNIHRANEKVIIQELKSALKDKGGEVKTKRTELSATGVSFPTISDSTFTIKAEVEEGKKLEYTLLVIFQYNDTILSSITNSRGYNTAKTFLHALANRISKEANEEHVKKQQKELEDLEKKLDGLEKKLEKEESQIVKSNKQIKKEQGEIDKIDKKGELNEKTINSRAKSEKDILKAKEEIKDAEYNIEINKKEQKKTLEEIKNQRTAVKEAQKSLDVFR